MGSFPALFAVGSRPQNIGGAPNIGERRVKRIRHRRGRRLVRFTLRDERRLLRPACHVVIPQERAGHLRGTSRGTPRRQPSLKSRWVLSMNSEVRSLSTPSIRTTSGQRRQRSVGIDERSLTTIDIDGFYMKVYRVDETT